MRMTLKALAFAAAATMTATAAQAVPATGVLNGSTLFDFDTAAVGVNNQRAISGLAGVIVGIDYRPATGALYGLSSTGGLYTINVTTGAATLASTLSAALTGTVFDIAFNPTVDRLRVVGNDGQNLRVNVDNGAVTVDGTLNRGGVTATGVVAAAYTNQVAGATSTILYDLDNTTLYIQTPPNNGTLTAVGNTTAGLTSFDIDAATGVGYVSSGSTFSSIDLVTGATTPLGQFGTGGVTDFAIAPVAVPEPLSLALLGTGLAGTALLRRRASKA